MEKHFKENMTNLLWSNMYEDYYILTINYYILY
jgi:hypothetical protein